MVLTAIYFLTLKPLRDDLQPSLSALTLTFGKGKEGMAGIKLSSPLSSPGIYAEGSCSVDKPGRLISKVGLVGNGNKIIKQKEQASIPSFPAICNAGVAQLSCRRLGQG